jgi:hypothetical protein
MYHYMVTADAKISSTSNKKFVFTDKILYSMYIVFIRRNVIWSSESVKRSNCASSYVLCLLYELKCFFGFYVSV